ARGRIGSRFSHDIAERGRGADPSEGNAGDLDHTERVQARWRVRVGLVAPFRLRPIFPLFVVIVVRPRPVVPVVRPRPVVPVIAPLPVVPVVTSSPVVAILTTSGRVVALFKNRAAPSAELLSISP